MSMVPLNLQGELSSVAFGLPRATLHHQTGYNLLRAKRCQANSIKINYTGSPTAIKRFASRSPDGRPSKMACHRRVQKYIMLHNHLLLWFLCIFQVLSISLDNVIPVIAFLLTVLFFIFSPSINTTKHVPECYRPRCKMDCPKIWWD